MLNKDLKNITMFTGNPILLNVKQFSADFGKS